MYARIVPLKRLPNNLSICDYHVPEHMDSILQVGQMVSIPFRKSNLFGLVLSLENTSEYGEKVKDIQAIVHNVPFFRMSEITLLEMLAEIYHTPFGSIMESALLPLQKRKLQTIELKPLPEHQSKSMPIEFAQYLDESEHQKLLISFTKKQTLILISEIQKISKIRSYFPPETRIALWHSELSTKEKFSTWLKIRNGEVDVIIGTRSTLFLPFFDLKNIIIDAEEEKSHKHDDGTPRIHVKDIAPLVGHNHAANVFFTSSHPSSETYHALYKKTYKVEGKTIDSEKTLGVIKKIPRESPTFIDLKSERVGHKKDYFLSQSVQEKIAQTHGDVFLFLNRRGSATSIFCQACGFRDTCPTCNNIRVYHETDRLLHCHYCKVSMPMPTLCPKCHTQILSLQGYGTEQIEKTLEQIQTKTSAKIIRLDSDIEEKKRLENINSSGQKIIVGTELSLQYIDWKNVSLCVCLNLDTLLSLPEYMAEEKLWHTVQHIQYERRPESTFLIQTHIPDHPFWKSLNDPDLFYRTDLKKRKNFSYPPYSFLVKYIIGKASKTEAYAEAKQVHQTLEKLLTKDQKKGTMYDPIELHPHYFRKMYWYGIILLLEPNNWMEILKEINKNLGENWKVDPRPNSIFSP